MLLFFKYTTAKLDVLLEFELAAEAELLEVKCGSQLGVDLGHPSHVIRVQIGRPGTSSSRGIIVAWIVHLSIERIEGERRSVLKTINRLMVDVSRSVAGAVPPRN